MSDAYPDMSVRIGSVAIISAYARQQKNVYISTSIESNTERTTTYGRAGYQSR